MSRAFFTCCIGLASFFLMVVPASASVVLKDEKIVFSPQSGGTPVSINFKGRLFKKKNGIRIDEKAKDTVAAFIHTVIEANKTKDVNKILALWAPSERSRLMELMSDKASMEKNSALFLNMRKSRLVGVMEYGKYLLVYALHDLVGVGDYVKLYPLLRDGDKLFMTNELSEDYFYNVIAEQIIRYQWP